MQAHIKWQHFAVTLAGLAALLWSAPGLAQPALHDVAALRGQVGRFAGAPARLDPQLVVPRCAAPAFSWARTDVVRVDCADPAWSLYVPIDQAGMASPAAAPARPAIRRGDRVMVQASGQGFAVTLEAEAERDADGSRIALKTSSGRRLVGRIEHDGRVIIAR